MTEVSTDRRRDLCCQRFTLCGVKATAGGVLNDEAGVMMCDEPFLETRYTWSALDRIVTERKQGDDPIELCPGFEIRKVKR